MNSISGGITYISAEDVEACLTYDDLIPTIEETLEAFSRKDDAILQPLRTVCRIRERGVIFVMPGGSLNHGLGCKVLTRYPPPQEGTQHSGITGIVVLFDINNGSLQAVVDAGPISWMRTAAASAIATKYLARDDSRILAILGAGRQAKSHLDALKFVKNFTEVRVWNRTHARAVDFASKYDCIACENAQDAVKNADVIVTVTSSDTPILFSDWVKDGAHINCVGAVRLDQQELESELVRRGVIYTDCREAAMKESGDIVNSRAEVFGEIGEVTLGICPARKNETTIFKSLGLSVEDIVAAKIVYDKARLASKN